MNDDALPRAAPRVGIVYPVPFGDGGIVGGGERYAEGLARALALRAPTRLVTFGEAASRRRDGELDRVVVRARRFVHGNRLNPLSFAFLRWLRDREVIHCTSWNTLPTDFSILFAKLAGKRVFVTDVGGGASFSLSRRLRLARWLDGLLLIAEAGGAGFEEVRDRWRIVGGGIDLDRYHSAPLAGRSGIAFVGRLLPHKGIDVLIRALRPEWQLTVVGRPYHDDYLQRLRALAAGKQVRFITDATDEQVREVLVGARAVVLPSVERTVYGDPVSMPELLGFAAVEAMASGTPVVVTTVGGLPELVRDGESGLVVPPGDVGALERAIAALVADDGLARRLGAAGRARIESGYTWRAVADRCLAAYGSKERR